MHTSTWKDCCEPCVLIGLEKTGVNVNVKSLLAPWLVRHCTLSLTRFATGADGQTAFKRQRGKDYVGETACFW